MSDIKPEEARDGLLAVLPPERHDLVMALYNHALGLNWLLFKSGHQGHEHPCFYCGEPCDAWTGNGSKWPVALPHDGMMHYHHMGCVAIRLNRRAEPDYSAFVAQGTERHTSNVHVTGSNPVEGAK